MVGFGDIVVDGCNLDVPYAYNCVDSASFSLPLQSAKARGDKPAPPGLVSRHALALVSAVVLFANPSLAQSPAAAGGPYVVCQHAIGRSDLPTLIDRPDGQALLVVDGDDRAVVAIDARTGVTRWRTAAPAGVSLAFHRDGLGSTLVAGQQPTGSIEAEFVLNDGRLRWWAPVRTHAVDYGASGSGVFLRAQCSIAPLDPSTGLQGSRGNAIAGGSIEFEGASEPECTSMPLPIADNGASAVLVVRETNPGHATLRAVDASHPVDRPSWLLAVPSPAVDYVGFDVASETLWLAAPAELFVARIDFSTGHPLWLHRAPIDPSCRAHDPRDAVRPVPAPAGMAHALLVQPCDRAELLDAGDGRVVWSRSVGTAMAAVEREGPHGEWDAIGYPSFAGGHDVVWLTRDGAPAGRVTVPRGTTPIVWHDGLILRTPQRISLVERSAVERWHVDVRSASVRVRGDVVAVQTPAPYEQWLFDAHTGARLCQVPDAEWTIAVLPATATSRRLAIVGRREPASVFAVDLGP